MADDATTLTAAEAFHAANAEHLKARQSTAHALYGWMVARLLGGMGSPVELEHRRGLVRLLKAEAAAQRAAASAADALCSELEQTPEPEGGASV